MGFFLLFVDKNVGSWVDVGWYEGVVRVGSKNKIPKSFHLIVTLFTLIKRIQIGFSEMFLLQNFSFKKKLFSLF